MNIQRHSLFVSIIYLIFLDQTDSSSEETSDENNDLLFYYECIDVIERNNSLRAVHRQARRARSFCWFNNICSSWENMEFKRHFRITKTTFEWLCTEIAPILLQRNNSRGAPRLPIKQKVSVTLWFLATGQSYRTLGQLFALGETTICFIIRSVLYAIKCHFLSSKISNIAKKFKRKAGIPYAIGAIDGSHIPIKAPKEYPMDYYNRKGFYSIVLQAVVDSYGRFIDIFVGYPGSTHDSRIFHNSPLYYMLSSSSSVIPSNSYILGDAGYPCQNWLLTPYRDNGRLTQIQTYYNTKHSQTRISVEQAFGKLKSRFRCLINPIATSLETAILIVTTSCILHNICEEREEDMLDDDEYFDDQNNFHTLSNNNNASEI
ncbi:12447_t:CDS:2 [Rhizophagus irregularis]|nr:12447_t:CDS:2 [Rhizophagus irregularis]